LSDQTPDDASEYVLIDPPVVPFSSEEDILAWINELKALPDRPEVRSSIEEAKNWFKRCGMEIK